MSLLTNIGKLYIGSMTLVEIVTSLYAIFRVDESYFVIATVKIILWLKLVVYRHTNQPVKKNFKKNHPWWFGGPICLKDYNSVLSSKTYLLIQF